MKVRFWANSDCFCNAFVTAEYTKKGKVSVTLTPSDIIDITSRTTLNDIYNSGMLDLTLSNKQKETFLAKGIHKPQKQLLTKIKQQ